MNAMLTRLDLAATRQRQFVSDASHEQRSPDAAIRTGLEVARSRSNVDWHAVTDKALANEARLERLLDDLLLLAVVRSIVTRHRAGSGQPTAPSAVPVSSSNCVPWFLRRSTNAGRPCRGRVQRRLMAASGPRRAASAAARPAIQPS